MKTLLWAERFDAARRVGTPLVALETADSIEAARTIARQSKDAVLWWDCAAGVRPLNEVGSKIASSLYSDPTSSLNLIEALSTAQRMPECCVLFLSLASRFCEEPAVIQAIQNLREPWKAKGCTLVLLMQPGSRLPQELSQDVMLIELPLPSAEALLPMINELSKAAEEQLGKPQPPEKVRMRAAEALVGLTEFAAESACALAIDDGGLLPEVLWERKRSMVNQTPGLQLIPPGSETFDQVGGLRAIRDFGKQLFESGKAAPRLIVWIDELEKAIGGAGGTSGVGDTSGTSQDQLGVLLRHQEENGWAGILLVGPPGSGKSMVAKALGATYRAPTIMLDLGALKGSLVGQSEQRVRAAMRIIFALAGREALFVATCNRLESIPPELRRRYKYGIWFADLPTAEERAAIWKIHLAAFKLKDKPVDQEWTGAEIRNCCELAARLGISTADAANYIVPVSQSDPEGVERLRKAADGRFLSVSSKGPYRKTIAATGRSFKNAL